MLFVTSFFTIVKCKFRSDILNSFIIILHSVLRQVNYNSYIISFHLIFSFITYYNIRVVDSTILELKQFDIYITLLYDLNNLFKTCQVVKKQRKSISCSITKLC